jgi:hypothetical protein
MSTTLPPYHPTLPRESPGHPLESYFRAPQVLRRSSRSRSGRCAAMSQSCETATVVTTTGPAASLPAAITAARAGQPPVIVCEGL